MLTILFKKYRSSSGRKFITGGDIITFVAPRNYLFIKLIEIMI